MKSAKIHLLPDEIINKIAAGEVIERPASAVKELMENSIDAGATRIQVQIEQGGKKRIQVTDNGKGMNSADLDLCYLRHTTSKLSNADDLFHLHTNGFRGEAVASIAAVSKLTITSATDDGDSGRIILEGGNVIEKQDVQASRGTTFLVEELFYNTPVRRNFLSSETATFIDEKYNGVIKVEQGDLRPIKDAATNGSGVIKVCASENPHREILESSAVKNYVQSKGYTLSVTVLDWTLQNDAVANGDYDANYFQHRPYLQTYNELFDVVAPSAKVHFEPLRLYRGRGK